jgi:hypothetical protein
MKHNLSLLIVALLVAATSALAGTTITYTYDAQYRLVQASYSESDKEFYNYDAAGNLDLYVAVTDASFLNSFLLYLTYLENQNRPMCYRPDYQPDALRQALDRAAG